MATKPKQATKQAKKSKTASEPKESAAKLNRNAAQIRKVFLESLTQELIEKGTVRLTNFGIFSLKYDKNLN